MEHEIQNRVALHGELENKDAWQIPTITRIDIRRTMGGSGPNPDAPSGTTIF